MLLVFAGLLLGACTTSEHYQTTSGSVKKDSDPSVLLMPSDVLLQELTAGGLLETNAAWTELGERQLTAALRRALTRRGLEIIPYDRTKGAAGLGVQDTDVQLVKLHEVVGSTIMLHKVNDYYQLPSKANSFDWTLGTEVRSLRDRYGADYALFVFMRDSFSSSGRVALQFFSAVLLGVAPHGGRQVGFASLVDLNSGNILWFNYMASEVGDLREQQGAEEATQALLENFPL